MISILLLSVLSAAPFEGVVEMKLKTFGGDGRIVISTSAAGVRSDGVVKLGPSELQTHVIVRAKEPTVSYLFDLSKNKWIGQTTAPPATRKGTLTAKLLPDEKVAGILCRHVVLKDARGAELEYWTTKKLFPNEAQAQWMKLAQKTPPEVEEVLASVEASGFVLKLISKNEGKVDLQMEAERVQPKKVSSRWFDISRPPEEKTK